MNNFHISTFISTLDSFYCLDNQGNFFGINDNIIKEFNEYKSNRFIKQLLIQNITMISCGDNHIICLNYDNEVFGLGDNYEGALGLQHIQNTDTLQKIELPPICFIDCGANFTLCVTTDKTIYSFGENSCFQLGFESDLRIIDKPTLIPNLFDVEFIDCGGASVKCKTKNNYYIWGDNTYGQLGNCSTDTIRKPTIVDYPIEIIDIKSGYYHTLFLSLEGNIYSCGNNNHGQLGLGSIDSIQPPTLIENLPQIVRISCGADHSMCIDINSNLWVFGDNGHGQLGLGDKKERYTPVKNSIVDNVIDISYRGEVIIVKSLHNIYKFGIVSKEINEQDNEIYSTILTGYEEIWYINKKSRAKSARK